MHGNIWKKSELQMVPVLELYGWIEYMLENIHMASQCCQTATGVGVKTGRENPIPTGSVFRFTRPYTVFIGKTGKRSGNGKKVSVAGTEMILRFS